MSLLLSSANLFLLSFLLLTQNWISRIARVCRVSVINLCNFTQVLPHPVPHFLPRPVPPPLAPPPQNDISSRVLSSNRKGSRVDNNNDEQQFFPMTFVKARISCQIPKQTNADLPYTYNRLSECPWSCGGWAGPVRA